MIYRYLIIVVFFLSSCGVNKDSENKDVEIDVDVHLDAPLTEGGEGQGDMEDGSVGYYSEDEDYYDSDESIEYEYLKWSADSFDLHLDETLVPTWTLVNSIK